MRTRITFLAGFAAGFVAGTRAGRERYEQMVKLGRKAVENPTVRRATRAASIAVLPPPSTVPCMPATTGTGSASIEPSASGITPRCHA